MRSRMISYDIELAAVMRMSWNEKDISCETYYVRLQTHAENGEKGIIEKRRSSLSSNQSPGPSSHLLVCKRDMAALEH